jgi:hypothetical protein
LETNYRRLPGRYRTPLSASSVWLGSDHLLLVNSTRISESYKRFYYRDIQAIVVNRRIESMVRDALIIITLVVVAILNYSNVYVTIPCGIALAIFLVWRLRSPRCITQLSTALQTERLRSLHRVSIAKRAIAEIEPYIAEAQKDIVPVPGLRPMAPMIVSPQLRSNRGTLQEILFFYVLVAAVLRFALYVFQPRWRQTADSMIGTVEILLTTWAVSNQRGSALGKSVQRAVWFALGRIVVAIGLAVVVLRTGTRPLTPAEWRISYAFSIPTGLALGVVGLVLLYRDRRRMT